MADPASKFLADPNVDVRIATENALGEFLREIKYIANVQETQAETERQRAERRRISKVAKHKKEVTGDDADTAIETGEDGEGEDGEEWEGEGTGAWVPGQGVVVNHAAIMDIVIQHLSYPGKLMRNRV